MRELEPLLTERNLPSVVIGLGDLAHARKFESEMKLPHPLLVDSNREAYRAAGFAIASPLHLLRPGNLRSLARAKAAGHRQAGLGQHPMQLGGTLVIAPDGRLELAHRSRTFGDNAPTELIAEALAKL